MKEKKSKIDNITILLDELKNSIPRNDCWTCDCLQGFLTQLEIDTNEDISQLIEPLKVSHSKMHCCLGCNPCPPAERFSNYLRSKKR